MSLDWGFDDITDWKTLCWEEDGTMNPVTNALIWMTMSIGMNRITEANWTEFATRIHMLQKADGPWIEERKTVDGEEKRSPRPITPLEINQHIGLHTKASPKTKTQFMK